MTSELITFNHLRCHSSSTALGTRTGYWKPTRRGTDETPCYSGNTIVLIAVKLGISECIWNCAYKTSKVWLPLLLSLDYIIYPPYNRLYPNPFLWEKSSEICSQQISSFCLLENIYYLLSLQGRYFIFLSDFLVLFPFIERYS